MAKKKQKLSAEELLDQALVPESEWPYEVPENWVWTRFGSITKIVGGGTPPSKVIEYYENGTIPWISPVDLSGYNDVFISHGKKNITKLGLKNSSAKLMPKDTVLLSSRAPIGYVAIAANELCTNQGFKSFLPSNSYLPKYLYYYLKYSKEILESYASGTTFLELSGSKAANVKFPLPPLPEQKCIVARIESLFDKLDQARGLIQDALDLFENRKAAILYKAFSGELTKKWREENSVGMENWEEKILSDVCIINPKRIETRGLSDDLMVSFIPMPAVSDILGTINQPQERKLGQVKKGYTNFREDDVIFAKITPCMENGKSAIVGELLNGIGFGSTEFHVFRCSERIYNRFLYHLLRSQSFRDEAKAAMAGAVGQQRVPKNFLESYSLMLPQLDEQIAIVKVLDSVFEREQNAKELYKLIDNIELMKKSILARAFRGDLGTNDPQEESAIELIKEIL